MLLSIGLPQAAVAQFYDVAGGTLDFSGGPTSGFPNAIGESYTYPNVITIGGVQIDAKVEVVGLSNATIGAFDSTSNPYSTNAYFQPNLTMSAVGGYAEFAFTFLDGSTPVTLENVYINTYDLDGSGGNPGKQFTDFSGITSFALDANTKLEAVDQGSGVTRFLPIVDTDNITSAPGTAVGDQYRARVFYSTLASPIRIKIGDQTQSGLAYYGIDFSQGIAYANPPVDEPIAADPLLRLTKNLPVISSLSDGADIGDTIEYTITAENIGVVDVTMGSLTDTFTRTTNSIASAITPAGTLSSASCSGGANSSDAVLSANETCVWTYSYTLVAADLNADTIENIATLPYTVDGINYIDLESSASGNETTGTPTNNKYSGTVTQRQILIRELTAQKTVTSVADTNGDLKDSAGDTVNFEITVSNTGEVDYESVSLSNDTLTRGTDGTGVTLTMTAPSTNDNTVDTTLAVGETWTYTASYVLTQDDIDAGGVSNIATFTGTPRNSITPESVETSSTGNTTIGAGNGSATSKVITQDPSINGTKTAALTNDVGSDGFGVGDTVTYTVTATNTGNVTLTNVGVYSDTLTQADDTAPANSLSSFTIETNGSTTLAPGESVSFTATYLVDQADIDAGGLLNTATVIGTPPSGAGNEVTDVTDDADDADGNTDDDKTELRSIKNPVLEVTKTVDDASLDDGVRAGDVLVYTITVKNVGNVTLDTVTIADTLTPTGGTGISLTPVFDAESDAGSDQKISVGETWTWTYEYALLQSDLDAGGVANVATVSAEDPQGDPVVAQSKVDGNTNANGDPTPTGFPGEISGSVIEYQAGVPNIEVYLLEETSPGVFDYVIDPETQSPVTTITDENGDYTFVGLPAGSYGVEFHNPEATSEPTATSAEYTETANRITGIAVEAGAVEIDQDAFLVDPSGVVYDSLSYAPISGAVVTLYYQASAGAASTVVPDSWLDTNLGDANGVSTAADGQYTFFLDPSVAQDGIYSIQVVKAGYSYVSQIIEPNVGPYNPGLGGSVVNISSDATTSDTMDTTYYTSFRMVFDASNINATSNGVAQNHIPLDASIIPEIEEDLTEILKDDLAATMTQHSRQMSSFAAGALNRLKQRDANTCAADIADILEQAPVQFATASAVILPQSAGTLDAIAGLLETCPEAAFEVAGHTDDRASDEYNLQLSQSRAASVVAALRQRGVPVDRLASAGYGESRPIADNATEEGRQLNRRVEFVPLEAQAIEMPCRDTTEVDRNIDLQANENGVSGSGDFNSETRDCAIDGWRIFSGSLSYLETDDGIAQGMFSLNYRVERFVNNDRVSGWFVGMYSAKDDITGLATGEINGFGLNGGIYGALRLQENLFADYYLGAAAGRHTFNLDFDRPLGTINVDGFYTYYALFAGGALSGEFDVSDYVIAPRVGVDLAWSQGGEADLTASRAGFEEAGSLSTGTVSGGRVFAEVSLVDLLVDQPEVLSFTPRVFCDRGIGSTETSCGFGATIEFSSENERTGETFGIALDVEGTEDSERYALTVNMGQPLFGGQLETSGGVTQSGNLDLGLNFSKEF